MSIGDLARHIRDARVIYRSREEAEKDTGYFSVGAVKITADLGSRLWSYLQKERLNTWFGENKAQTSENLYTLKFTLRAYSTYAWLNRGSARGYLKRHQASREYEALMKRTPDLDEIYFCICRKYPEDVITVQYQRQPPGT